MKNIFKNVSGKAEQTCLTIDLTQIDLIYLDGRMDNGNFEYKVALKSGAIVTFNGVGLFAAYEKFVKTSIIDRAKTNGLS